MKFFGLCLDNETSMRDTIVSMLVAITWEVLATTWEVSRSA